MAKLERKKKLSNIGIMEGRAMLGTRIVESY